MRTLVASTAFLFCLPLMSPALASVKKPSNYLLAQIAPKSSPSPESSAKSPSPSPSGSPAITPEPSPTSQIVTSPDSSATTTKPSTTPQIVTPPQAVARNVDRNNFWLLVIAIVSSSSLMGIVIFISIGRSSGTTSDNTPGNSELNQRADFIAKTFPRVIEGITVYLIVAVVAVLSLSATITPEGTIGIISGISGYVLGKQSATKEEQPKS